MLAFLSSICLLFLLFPLLSSAHRPIINGSRKHLDHHSCKTPTGCQTIPEQKWTRLTVYHSPGHKPPAIDTFEMTDGSSREEVHHGTSEWGTDNYVVTIGLGTPPRDMTVVMDTGSVITWVQCFPCTTNKCHPQRDDIFQPAMSSTYQTFDCDSPQCKLLPDPNCSADDRSCSYKATYMDNSYSSGQFASDRLTLNAGDTIDNFLFGCGHDQKSELFGQTSGLLGLGPPTGPSLLNQAADTSIGRSFAYCLPQADSTGYLEFGSGAADEGSSFATLTSIGDRYFVDLLAVEVNGAVPGHSRSTKMMVDTGTVLSRLPAELYSAIKSLVEKEAGEALVPGAPQEYFSDCYEIVANGTKELLPINVTLKLGGGAQLVLDDASVFHRVVSSNSTCLAFVIDDKESVLGNIQQRTYRWSFDIDNSRIALTPKAC